MTLPYTFTPGTIASATEVNENFNHVMGIVGADSTTEDMKPSGDVLLGPRDAVQLTAKGDTDTTGTGTKYFQVGWNCDMYNEGSTFRQRRIVNNEGATVLRVGSTGVEALATARTDSTLDEQLQTAVGIRPHYSNGSQNPWVYINPSWKLQWRDQVADQSTHLNYRNTLTFMDISGVDSMYLYGSGNYDEISWSSMGVVSSNQAQYRSNFMVTLNLYDKDWAASGIDMPSNVSAALITVFARWYSSGTTGSNDEKKSDDVIMRVYAEDTGGDALSSKTGFVVQPQEKYTDSAAGSKRQYLSQVQGIVRFGSFQTGRGKFTLDLRANMRSSYSPTMSFLNPSWNLAVLVQGVYF